MPAFAPNIAFNRFGLGPRPGDLQRVSGDPRADLCDELGAAGAALTGVLLPSAAIVLLVRRYAVRRKSALDAGDTVLVESLGRAPQIDIYLGELSARIEKTRVVETGFLERLVAFWANHFAISIRMNGLIHGLAGSFEREAIRPHVIGKFHDMLLAATSHPAMLLYLNNVNSFGPNSESGIRRQLGLNENHARELLELHTVGVDGGYSQADVTAFARVLTGWTVDQNEKKPETCGRFVFRPASHEPGPATIMGVTYPQHARDQGEAVLADLARNPATARHVAKKLAVHFVSDDPPSSLVDNLASTFQRTDGDLREMAAALVMADASWGQPTKIKTPQEFVWSAVRALSLDLDVDFLKRALQSLGQPFWNPPSPNGFSDDSGAWLAPDAMTNRLDIATDLASRAAIDVNPGDLARAILGPDASEETMDAIGRAESRVQALALMLMSPEFQRR
jgi:uncharacterized protein (DUF1800 family)